MKVDGGGGVAAEVINGRGSSGYNWWKVAVGRMDATETAAVPSVIFP